MEPIDIVIPWVDDTDPVWKKDRDFYVKQKGLEKRKLVKYFRDWDTLKYVFRGIEKFMPWVRHIHFVTYGHLPEWLDTTNPKIKIQKHKDFFGKEAAFPVFNASAIEMNLKNIPGLAEKFIYFNDDTLVCKPVTPERFYKGNLPVDHLVLDIPRGGWLYDKIRIKDPYSYLCRKNVSLLNSHFPLKELKKRRPELFFDSSYLKGDILRNRILSLVGEYKWIKVNHHPQAFLLSNLWKCYELFKEEMDQTSKSRFSSFGDINQYIYREYALMTGQFIPHFFNDSFCIVLSSAKNYEKEREELFKNTFVCVNDSPFLPSEEYPALKERVDADLQSLFPDKSSFEK